MDAIQILQIRVSSLTIVTKVLIERTTPFLIARIRNYGTIIGGENRPWLGRNTVTCQPKRLLDELLVFIPKLCGRNGQGAADLHCRFALLPCPGFQGPGTWECHAMMIS